MKNTQLIIHSWPWVLFPIATGIIIVSIVCIVDIPLIISGINERSILNKNYIRKKEAEALPDIKNKIRHERILIDSIIRQIKNRNAAFDTIMIDELHRYAKEAGFFTKKVKCGITQKQDIGNETPITIKGTGMYRSVGDLIEKIENSTQSTRIRHLTIKKNKSGMLNVVIDLVILEKASDAVK